MEGAASTKSGKLPLKRTWKIRMKPINCGFIRIIFCGVKKKAKQSVASRNAGQKEIIYAIIKEICNPSKRRENIYVNLQRR